MMNGWKEKEEGEKEGVLYYSLLSLYVYTVGRIRLMVVG